jgi:hypothetical protein
MGLGTAAWLLLLAAHHPRASGTYDAVWFDLARCGVDRARAQAEVSEVLSPLGVRVSWRSGAGHQTEAETLRVILVRSRPSALDPWTMGSSNPGSSTPSIWVFCDNVARTLAAPGTTADGLAREAMGVAVGRVVAHELVHLLAPGRPHDRSGLFAAHLDGHALRAPGARLSPAFVRWYSERRPGDGRDRGTAAAVVGED